MMTARLSAWAVAGIPEVAAGDDLTLLIGDALAASAPDDQPQAGDIVVVTSKIVSKAEGRFVRADDREQAITDETVRVVATRVAGDHVTRIVENRLGIVGAAAGVDASNTPEGHGAAAAARPGCLGRRDLRGAARTVRRRRSA